MKYLLITFIVVAEIASVFGQDPQITKDILPEVKRAGETAYLNCTVAAQGNNKVYWIHTETTTQISSDDTISVDHNIIVDGRHKFDIRRTAIGDRTTYQLIIRRLQQVDTGTYRCKILVRGETTDRHPSKDGQLRVLVPPILILSQTTSTATVAEGQNVELRCNATGYPKPKITWVRPNGNVIQGGKFREDTNILKLKNVRKEDRGVYRCVADNNVKPSAMQDITLWVFFRPSARPVQSSYGQAQNREYRITLECRISGYPEPLLAWYKIIKNEITGQKGLRRITNDEKHDIQTITSHGNLLGVSEVWFQLTVINVQAGDYGDYVCEGENKYGNNQAIVNLYEIDDPYGSDIVNAGGGKGHVLKASILLVVMATALSSIFH